MPTTKTVTIDCPHGAICGGCSEIGTPYADQLAKKTARLVRALALYPDVAASTATAPTMLRPVRGAEVIEGYRTRAKWMVGPNGELGLFARENAATSATSGGARARRGPSIDSKHRVVDIPHCRVLPEPLRETADAIRALMATAPLRGLRAIDARHIVPPTPSPSPTSLRARDTHTTTRPGVGRAAAPVVLVTLIVERSLVDTAAAHRFAEALVARAPLVGGVALGTREADAIQVLGDAPRLLLGAPFADDDVGGPRPEAAVRATFGAFVQAHRGQARVLIDAVLDALPPKHAGAEAPRVLDVYGGSGAFSLAAASVGADVELIESFAPAAQLAEDTARGRGLSVRAHAGDAGALLDDASTEPFDLVIVNPPRRGVVQRAREAIARTALQKLVYVSCEPTTLARDLAHFARSGLTLERLLPVDMMPQTTEIETVAVLRRGRPSAPRRVFEDDASLFIDKDPYEPLAPGEGTSHGLLLRVRALSGWGEAAPLEPSSFDPDSSGLCGFVRHPRLVPAWSSALTAEGASVTYLALARGITHAKGNLPTRPSRGEPRGGHAAPASRPSTSASTSPSASPVPARFRRRAVVAGHSLLQITVAREARHLVRQKLASIGHPIVGDARFGDAATTRYFQERWGLDRPFLHAHERQFVHPDTNEPIRLLSPLPADLAMLIEALGSRAKGAHQEP